MTQGGQLLPSWYRKLAIAFISASAILCVLALYLVWSKAIIVLHPSEESIARDLVLSVAENGDFNREIVNGRVEAIELVKTATFPASGSETVETDAVGEVTITNNYSQSQVLVETTRLASPEAPGTILVRLKQTVTVPPGGSVRVQVYPDNPATFSELPPQRFIIPGLWEGLRSQIYAENSEPLKTGGYNVPVVTEEDLQKAKDVITDQLYQEALAEVENRLSAEEKLWPRLVTNRLGEANFSALPGQQVAEFQAEIKLTAIVVAFDENQLIALVKDKLERESAEEKKIVSLDRSSFKYELQEHNTVAKNARIKATLQVNSTLASNLDFIDYTELTGKSAEEIKNYFAQFAAIKSVDVAIHPAWHRRTPKFEEKISVKVAE